MKNSWSSGQYSVFRTLFGIYLFVHFAYLAFWAADIFSYAGMVGNAELSPLIIAFPNILRFFDSPAFVTIFSIAAAFASLLFAIGKWDKPAALFMWFALACFVGRNPLITNPAMPYVGWMLLAHLFIIPAPYLSWAARGRADPDNGWRMSNGIFLAGWIILALTYSYSGYTKLLSPSWVAGENIEYVLNNPLARDWFLRDIFLMVPEILLKCLTWFILVIELLFAPLALIKRLRPWLWSGMLFVQFGFAFLLNFPDLTIAMLLFHLFTFNPAWLPPRSLKGTVIYFDGTCALCHGTVRFMLAEEARGELVFSALQDRKLEAAIGEGSVENLGDTVVVRTADERILIEAEGIIYLLCHLGGLWRLLSWLMRAMPKPVRRTCYHFIGNRRYRIFGKKDDFCPIIPSHLRERFIKA